MTEKSLALKNLLSNELPLERIGPHLRRSVKRAVLSGDERRMGQVARIAVTELLRRGDLLRIAIEGVDDPERPLVLLKGTNRLIDLSPLHYKGIGFDAEDLLEGSSAVPGVDRAGSRRMDEFAGLLGAMEQAQDLEIGNPSSSEPAVVLSGILRLLARLTPQFRLYMMMDGDETLPEDQDSVFHLDPGDPAAGWLGARDPGQAFWIPDPDELPRQILRGASDPEQEARLWNGQPYTCAVAIPLWEPVSVKDPDRDPKEAGLFFLVAREQWSKEALLKLARRLGSFVSRRWQRQNEVNQRIHKDRLTGVFNRAYFDDQFTLELERARRSQAPLTLVIADVDHFKAVNDRYGHQVGDIALKRLAHRLQSKLRRIDSICRIGGEEFAMILPHTSIEAGQDVLKRLLSESPTEEITYLDEVLSIDLTFSYGVASFPDGGADAFELYRKADAMLFLSKDKGRNQCHIWNSDGEPVRLLPEPSCS